MANGVDESDPIWIHVFRDTFCDLCLSDPLQLLTADVYKDGNHRLIALHTYQKQSVKVTEQTCTKSLRIFNETKLENEVNVKSTSTCLADVGGGIIAVPGGPSIYFFKEMKPYYRFDLMPLQTDVATQTEAAIWVALKQGAMEFEEGVARLKQLQEMNEISTSVSHHLLRCTNVDQRQRWIREQMPKFDKQSNAFCQSDCITCLTVIKIGTHSQRAVVFGTEMGFIVFLNDTGTAEIRRIDVGSPVQYICTWNEKQIVFYTRNGFLQTLTEKDSRPALIYQLASSCCGIVAIGSSIFAGSIPQVINCFNVNDKKRDTINTESAIQFLTAMYIPAVTAHCLLVLLQNGVVVIYHNHNVLHQISMSAPVSAITFGQYGTEQSVLSTVFKDGALDIKILRRTIDIKQHVCSNPSMMLEALSTDELPQLNACDMHVSVQRYLQQLRLETLKTFMRVRTDGEGSFAEDINQKLQLNAEIVGIGPRFQIRLQLTNTGQKTLKNLAVIFSADAALHRLQTKYLKLPWLIKDRLTRFNLTVMCKEERIISPSSVKLSIIMDGMPQPLLTALINIPVC